MTQPDAEPLPKPDKPGLWKVKWSNGETQEVQVIASGETLFFRDANLNHNPDFYRVNEGWLGRWWPVENPYDQD